MVILGVVILVVLFALLLVVTSISPRQSSLSPYELKRREKQGNQSAIEELRRTSTAGEVAAVIRTAEAVLLVGIALLLVVWWHYLGAVIALLVAILYRSVVRLELIRSSGQRLYEVYEKQCIDYVERHPSIGKFIGSNSMMLGYSSSFASREELEYMIDESSGILSNNEKKLLKSNLSFAGKVVSDVMTPRGVIETIDQHEVLGPIVLDQLHKTGHSRFPVTAGDIDHIVGILHIQELLMLEQKTSESVDACMEKKVHYIDESDTLERALAAFLSTHHHLFIVVNEYRETAGLITLEDCIEALIGRRIIDEFDEHDDLREYAKQHAKENNNTPHATDI